MKWVGLLRLCFIVGGGRGGKTNPSLKLVKIMLKTVKIVFFSKQYYESFVKYFFVLFPASVR